MGGNHGPATSSGNRCTVLNAPRQTAFFNPKPYNEILLQCPAGKNEMQGEMGSKRKGRSIVRREVDLGQYLRVSAQTSDSICWFASWIAIPGRVRRAGNWLTSAARRQLRRHTAYQDERCGSFRGP